MIRKVMYFLYVLTISLINAQIHWQNGQPTGTKWAMACDFKGNDLTNRRIAGANCASTCASTSGCTHFTWTTYNGGTCWMKSGSVSQSDAFYNGNTDMICGIIPSIY